MTAGTDPFTGRTAVVTGAGSGIGAALARELAGRGCRLVLADISSVALEAIEKELRESGADAVGILTDVSDPADVENLAAGAERRFGAVHIVCNNAGILATGPLIETPIETARGVMDVNFWGVFHGIRTFAPRLIRQGQGGHIVNSASLTGLQGVGELGIYSASKFAVVGISEALHQELKPLGIGVSVLCPMVVETQIADHASHRRGESAGEVVDQAPRLRQSAIKTPEHVAAQVARAILARKFYILTHEEERGILRDRADRLERACDWLDETALKPRAEGA